MMWKYMLAWIPMVFIGIANGALRELIYGGSMTELGAHQVSSLTAILLFVAYIWILSRFIPFRSERQAIAVGLMWFGLTVLFEFLFGHYVAQHSWSRLVQDYSVFTGRMWLIVLFVVAAAPYSIRRARGRGSDKTA